MDDPVRGQSDEKRAGQQKQSYGERVRLRVRDNGLRGGSDFFVRSRSRELPPQGSDSPVVASSERFDQGIQLGRAWESARKKRSAVRRRHAIPASTRQRRPQAVARG